MEYQIIEASSKTTLCDNIVAAEGEGWEYVDYETSYDGTAVLYSVLLKRQSMAAMSWWQRLLSGAKRRK